jgi:hypothetical protein
MRYLREGERLLSSKALRGVGPWGDQVALNVYCHTHPTEWKEISPAWNYCLACRDRRLYRFTRTGRFERTDGQPIHVVHGTGGTLGLWGMPA